MTGTSGSAQSSTRSSRPRGSRSCARRGGHRRPTPMPNGSSGRSAPSASIGFSSWANGIFDRCWRPTSSTTTASDPIVGSTSLPRKEPKTSRRYASTARSDVVTSWVARFTSTTEELSRPLRSGHPPASITPSEILEIGIGHAPGKVGLLGCSGVVLCTTIMTMRSRTQDTDSEVAPYRSARAESFTTCTTERSRASRPSRPQQLPSGVPRRSGNTGAGHSVERHSVYRLEQLPVKKARHTTRTERGYLVERAMTGAIPQPGITGEPSDAP